MSVTLAQAAPYLTSGTVCVLGFSLSAWGRGQMRELFIDLDAEHTNLVRKGPFLGDRVFFIALVLCLGGHAVVEDIVGHAAASAIALLAVGGLVGVRQVREHQRLRGVGVPESFRLRLVRASIMHCTGGAVGAAGAWVLSTKLKLG